MHYVSAGINEKFFVHRFREVFVSEILERGEIIRVKLVQRAFRIVYLGIEEVLHFASYVPCSRFTVIEILYIFDIVVLDLREEDLVPIGPWIDHFWR